jgi:outer membrane protein assembly factor BamB
MRFRLPILVLGTAALFLCGFGPATGDTSPGYWPQWRGPADDGMAPGAAPLHWSATQNVKWKATIPGRGHSSPVIWGDRIFLTTAIPTGAEPAAAPAPAQGDRRGPGGNPSQLREHKFDVLCIERTTGKLLWERTVRTATPHEGYHGQYGSFASNSPVTDGKNVYAFFGSRGLYCLTVDGKPVWERDFGVQMKMVMQFGEGTACVLHDNTLILNFDHEGGSFVAAVDKNSGKQLWRAEKDEVSGWAAPLIVDFEGRKYVVISSNKKVRCYDFKTGALVWECAGLGRNPIPAPVYANGIVYVMSGYRDPNLMAIRMGRTGDLTGTDAVVWSTTRGLSYTASPVLHENRLYVLTDQGMLSCFNASTGTPLYQQVRLPKPYTLKSSPIGAQGRLYISTEDGDVVVVRMGDAFEVIATNSMPDEFFIATPAVALGEMFLRGRNTLYCIHE